jgi:hypothetical protein
MAEKYDYLVNKTAELGKSRQSPEPYGFKSFHTKFLAPALLDILVYGLQQITSAVKIIICIARETLIYAAWLGAACACFKLPDLFHFAGEREIPAEVFRYTSSFAILIKLLLQAANETTTEFRKLWPRKEKAKTP